MITPTRLMRVAGAAIALAAYFLPSGAWPLVIALVVAVVGPGVAGVDGRYRGDLEQLAALERDDLARADRERAGLEDGGEA